MDIKNIIPETDWILFELESSWFDDQPEGPVIRLKLKPVLESAPLESIYVREDEPTLGEIIRNKAIEAVTDWDFTNDGKAVPITEANKKKILWPLLGLPLKGTEGKELLAVRILSIASNKESFTKK